MTVKVYDEPVNDLLAAKVQVVEMVAAQLLLQEVFFQRGMTAELFGSLDFGRANPLADDDVLGWHEPLS